MTYREFVECARPEIVNDACTGGVIGCPSRTQFKDGQHFLQRDCHTNENQVLQCSECWNKEMDVNETARAIEIYGSEWYLAALAYLEERKHDSSV